MLELSNTYSTLLLLLLAVPLLGAVSVPVFPARRTFSLLLSLINLGLSLAIVKFFDPGEPAFQFAVNSPLISSLGVRFAIGLDGISVWLVLFSNLLMLLAFLRAKEADSGYLSLLFLLQFAVLGTFVSLDVALFYFFWELMMIPNFFLLYFWGRSQGAAMKYALYTALGSLLMLVSIGTLGVYLQEQSGVLSFFVGDLIGFSSTERVGDLLLFGFLAAFFMKSAVFPFHTWLPDAHRAAPQDGSFDLTLVLPKVGLFGAIRFVYLLFPEPMVRNGYLLGALGVTALIYGALVAWKQTDLKRFLAYSTVSHVGLCLAAFVSMSEEGAKGLVFMMLGSGISIGGLFILVSEMERRFGIRRVDELGGLAGRAPVLSSLFLLFVMSAIGLPLTNGFIGEFLSIAGVFDSNAVLGIVATLGVIFAALYGLSLYRRVFFGKESNLEVSDLSLNDLVTLVPLAALVFVLGLYPRPILNGVEHALDLLEVQPGFMEELEE
jgi:NADH-quinone oxidoreductase subunit M